MRRQISALHVRLFHTIPAEMRTSSEVYARELGEALRRVGGAEIEVEDYLPSNSRAQRWLAQRRGLSAAARYWGRYVEYQQQVRTIPGAAINHIVEHGYGHLAFGLDPARTVITFHDAMLLKLQRRQLPTAYYPWLTMLGQYLSLKALRGVARVIAVSESTRRDLLAYVDYPAERVRVVPQGVAPIFFQRPGQEAPGRTDLQRQKGGFRILHVGHNGFYKNIERLLQVVAQLRRHVDRPVTLVKVGAAFSPEQGRLIVRLGLEDHVCHLGAVPPGRLPAVYRGADLLFFPSLYEGFGLPPLEAMASGIPVVASDRGSLPEVVGDAGLLVNPEDVEGMTQAVIRCLTDDPLRQELCQRGQKRAAAFTWERTARAMLAVYQELG